MAGWKQMLDGGVHELALPMLGQRALRSKTLGTIPLKGTRLSVYTYPTAGPRSRVGPIVAQYL